MSTGPRRRTEDDAAEPPLPEDLVDDLAGLDDAEFFDVVLRGNPPGRS